MPLERVDVHVEGFEIEADSVATNQEYPWAAGGKRLAERRECLSEALACLGVRSIPPQESREPFPGPCSARGKREVGEQCHGFLWDVERLRGGKMPVDSTEQRQAQWHGPYPPSTSDTAPVCSGLTSLRF